MDSYIKETCKATKALIELTEIESKELETLKAQLGAARAAIEMNLRASIMWEDDDDVRMQHYAVRSGIARRDEEEIKNKIKNLEQSIRIKDLSLAAICTAILQIAKQGIALTYPSDPLKTCPDGRNMGAENLKNIIWQGRNQSMHYDEGSFRKPVIECFKNLEALKGDEFSLTINADKNLAASIVWLLGWNDYDNYLRDITSLLQ